MKVRKVASSWRARYSALPRNCPSSATQACRAVPPCPDEVLKIQGDGPEDPGQGDAVEAQPRHVPRLDRRVDEDVVVEGVAAKGEEDLVPPAAVGGGRGVEEDGDQSPDVLDAGRLEVELGDHGVSRVVPSSSSSDRGLA